MEDALKEGMAVDFHSQLVAEVDSDGLQLVVPAQPPRFAACLSEYAWVAHYLIPDDEVGEVSQSVRPFEFSPVFGAFGGTDGVEEDDHSLIFERKRD